MFVFISNSYYKEAKTLHCIATNPTKKCPVSLVIVPWLLICHLDQL